ncbi:MAG TPA: WG repeat-containing protein [Steroidobacteraceae bacterium]
MATEHDSPRRPLHRSVICHAFFFHLLNNFLYILRPGGEPGELQKIARSNGVIPVMWEILLADAMPAASMDLRRVLDGVVVTCIAADANRALGRLRRFVELVLPFAQIDRVPALRRYLEGAQQHLGDLVAAWSLNNEPAPVLCLNLAELSHADPAALGFSMNEQLDRFAAHWLSLEQALGARDFSVLEDRLHFPSLNLGCMDWKTWAGQFGLALFKHDYFDGAFRRPLDGEYADHEYDALGADSHLGGAAYRYKSDGKWGVRRIESGAEFAVLEAQWDRVLRAGVDEEDLVWIKRGERFGLAAVAGKDGGRVLLEPQLDEVGPFCNGLAVVRVQAKAGFLSRSGEWHLPPSWDEAWPFVCGHAVVVVGERLGFIDARGESVIAAQFDVADDFSPAGVARVGKAGRYGLIRADGSFAADLRYEQLQWAEDFQGWLCWEEADGSPILLYPDGRTWVAAGWQSLEVMVPQRAICVARDNRVGLLNWSGEPILDCAYDELWPRFFHSAIPSTATATTLTQSTVQFAARRGDCVGLIDAEGVQLMPFEFSAIESLEPHAEDGYTLHRPELARVWSMPGRGKPMAGVWDIRRQDYVVPCCFDSIWLMLLGAGTSHVFVVITENPRGERSVMGKYRVGILRDDGSTLVPQEYAWIGERTALNREEAMHHLRGAIHYAWARNQAVEAARERNGPSSWVRRDGSLESREE